MSDTPWTQEYYHDDTNFDLLAGEKRAKGRFRLARTYATVLAKQESIGARKLASKLRKSASPSFLEREPMQSKENFCRGSTANFFEPCK
jgi:hypothetical protein